MTPVSPDDRAEPGGFRAIQYQFTGHIRDPGNCPAPADVEDRRMQIYRELLYNNVEDFLASGFPVLRKIMSDQQWHALMRDYFRRHRARTPLFPRMSREFLHYLEHEREVQAEDFPFMKELAHYEWLELAIFIDSRDIDMTAIDSAGDLLAGIPVLSPLAWPFAYRFPVHRISPAYLPREAPEQASYLVVYRDRTDTVGFLELNPVAARLLEYLQADNRFTGDQLLRQIASDIRHPDLAVVLQGGLQILQSMREKDIVLGTRLT